MEIKERVWTGGGGGCSGVGAMQLQPQITYAGGLGEGALTLNNTIIPTLFPEARLPMFHEHHRNHRRADPKFPDCEPQNRNRITPAG